MLSKKQTSKTTCEYENAAANCCMLRMFVKMEKIQVSIGQTVLDVIAREGHYHTPCYQNYTPETRSWRASAGWGISCDGQTVP